jgi:hypothetical protein
MKIYIKYTTTITNKRIRGFGAAAAAGLSQYSTRCGRKAEERRRNFNQWLYTQAVQVEFMTMSDKVSPFKYLG